jgi:predicted PurR-regulated permease PerM
LDLQNKICTIMDDKKIETGFWIKRSVDIAIRIALLFLLLYWCYGIIKPFIDIMLWSVIFAVAQYPLYSWFRKKLKMKKSLAASVVVALMLLMIVIPGLLFAKSLYEGVAILREQYENAASLIPMASEKLSGIPVVGPFLFEKWNWLSQHLTDALQEYAPQIKQVLIGLFSSLASAGAAFLKLIISIVLAGVLLVSSEKSGKLVIDISIKLIGEKGGEFAKMAEATIRTVIKGVVGVAFIQSILFGISMVLAGVPAAGLWFILSLILGIMQIGIFPVSIPVIIYVLLTKSTLTAIIFIAWNLVVSLIDNVLKPILMGNKAAMPMVVVFIGSIGGFIYSGLVGLFTGAVVFSVVYKLFIYWLEEEKELPITGVEEEIPN